MSLISKQIDELRSYAKDRKGELVKLINDAADTIEELSAKLHAANMERSSQYYNDGWIPCSERLPNLDRYGHGKNWERMVLITGYLSFDDKKEVFVSEALANDVINYSVHDTVVTAWMPLPNPYKERRMITTDADELLKLFDENV